MRSSVHGNADRLAFTEASRDRTVNLHDIPSEAIGPVALLAGNQNRVVA
jgi:hypothetical protein